MNSSVVAMPETQNSFNANVKMSFDQLEESFTQRELDFERREQKLAQDCAELEDRKDAWNAEMKSIAHTQAFQNYVNLNVGGHLFTTTIATLTRFPDSMLGAMFSGRHTVHKDEGGYVCIDRDGSQFLHILNFLREPDELSAHLFSDLNKDELLHEAKFFGLDSVMKNYFERMKRRGNYRYGVPYPSVRQQPF